jgi:hypothetical protein
MVWGRRLGDPRDDGGLERFEIGFVARVNSPRRPFCRWVGRRDAKLPSGRLSRREVLIVPAKMKNPSLGFLSSAVKETSVFSISWAVLGRETRMAPLSEPVRTTVRADRLCCSAPARTCRYRDCLLRRSVDIHNADERLEYGRGIERAGTLRPRSGSGCPSGLERGVATRKSCGTNACSNNPA